MLVDRVDAHQMDWINNGWLFQMHDHFGPAQNFCKAMPEPNPARYVLM
jgi:hypothetical protein